MAKLYRVNDYGEILEQSYDKRRSKLVNLTVYNNPYPFDRFVIVSTEFQGYKERWQAIYDGMTRALDRAIESKKEVALMNKKYRVKKRLYDKLKMYYEMEKSKLPRNVKAP